MEKHQSYIPRRCLRSCDHSMLAVQHIWLRRKEEFLPPDAGSLRVKSVDLVVSFKKQLKKYK